MTAPLKGKTAVVLGVADHESIAWSIARCFSEAGAHVVIGYQQKFLSRVRLLLEEHPNLIGHRCDVMNSDELQIFFNQFEGGAGIDCLVHSIAYGSPEIFNRDPSAVNTMDFSDTLEISAHSLSRVVQSAKPYLNPWGSVIALSFQASQRAMPLYGMMGVAKAALESLVRYLAIELGRNKIRINTLSPGPIETLASLSEMAAFKDNLEILHRFFPSIQFEDLKDIKDEMEFAKICWRKIQNEFTTRSPISEPITASDVAQTALFLASSASHKMTGQILTVDGGFSSCLIL